MSTTATQTWEYQTLYIPHPRFQPDKLARKDVDKALAEAGQDGWEAFAFFPNVNLVGERDAALVMCKRPG